MNVYPCSVIKIFQFLHKDSILYIRKEATMKSVKQIGKTIIVLIVNVWIVCIVFRHSVFNFVGTKEYVWIMNKMKSFRACP